MELDIENSYYGQKAKKLFLDGYNCSQSVFLAFEDKYDIDHSTAMRLSSSFGGGMGRLREVCGAVSGMFMVAGILYGYDTPGDFEAKSRHYARIQELAEEYSGRNGSIVCREILGLGKGKDDPVPSRRTQEYYKKRPCPDLVAMAAAIMEEYINQNEKDCDR
ncbi:MAG: C-GCAxxG-C-C family protein [Lachnospiraceae bacterium]|nr:C-GCAxxG-C-C family protein [Lachnospiraceae bacterium]